VLMRLTGLPSEVSLTVPTKVPTQPLPRVLSDAWRPPTSKSSLWILINLTTAHWGEERNVIPLLYHPVKGREGAVHSHQYLLPSGYALVEAPNVLPYPLDRGALRHV